ncbi:MAG: peptide ABC transporter substrate-binding protein [Chloroflexi bacterium]|nr:peptide ABC transporter substrate-binding protein [Chloroflexota bacterium]
MSRKKWLGVLMTCLLLLSLGAACGGPAATPETIVETVVVKETVEVAVVETVVVKETVEVPVEVTAAAAAPVEAAPAEAPAPGNQKIIWSLEGISELPGLDPANALTSQSILVMKFIFGGLVKLDAQLNVAPDGAESWTVSEDGKTYTFKIREGLKFADDTPVTAQNFADSINRVLQPETASYGAGFMLQAIAGASEVAEGKAREVEGVKVIDEQTLEITTKDVTPYFLAQLTFPYTFVLPSHFIQEQGEAWTEQAFGTGPFRVKEWQHNQKLILEANPNYWAGAVGVAEIEIPFNQEPETAYQLYRTGELDIMGHEQSPVPSARIPEVSSAPDFHQVAGFATEFVGFNNGKPPFDNVNVRRAFAMAVDKVTLADKVLNGAVGPANRMLPAGFPGSQLPVEGLAFDAEAAKAELTKAGYGSDKPFPQVTLTHANAGDVERVAAFLQQQWQDNLGVEVVLQPLELATFSDTLNQTFFDPTTGMDFWISIWGADYPDPQNFVSLQLLSDSPNNNGHWSNAEFDQLSHQADTFTGSAEERFKLYQQAEQIGIDEVGWLPLFSPRFSVLIKPYVSGIVTTGQGFVVPDWSAVRGRPLE